MMKRFFIIVAVIGLLASCPDPSNKHPNNKPIDPNNTNKSTLIIFDNTQGICTASVYDDYRRRDEDKIAEVPAGQLSAEIKWTSGDSVPFYFSYRVTIKGITDFSLYYVPETGRDQNTVRIDADKTTTIKIPALSESISSSDTLFSNNSYLFIQNNSIYSFELLRKNSKIKPDNISSSLVNEGEKAHYTINPGSVSNYQLLVGSEYKEFPGSIVNFEAGHIYIFDYNGSISLVNDIELKLENVNGFTIPQPPAPPTVIISNGSITLRWTAVESATAYEIWTATVNDSVSATKYGTDVASSLSATISGLNNGTTYYFWLKAKNNIGTSGFSPIATGTPSASTVKPPNPQTVPSIIAGDGQLKVSWHAVEDASVYEIWAGTTSDTQTATKQGEDVSGLSTIISGLNNGTNYYVWIKAKNNIGVSGFSPVANGKPLGTPGMPVIISDYNSLLVTWTAVAGAEHYEIYYGTDSPTTLATTTDGTSATITGLTNGTAYYVRLRVKNANGVSDYGPSASGMPIDNIGVITVISGDGQLSLSWSAVAGADKYEVYYSISNSIPESPAQTVTNTTATISSLTNGTTYYIWVKAKNAYGASNTSVLVSGKPLGTPGTPTITPGYGQLLVSWTAVAGADEYEVYYGTGTPTTLAVTTASTTVTIKGLPNGTAYNIRLRARNASGFSDYGPSTSGITNDSLNPGLYRDMVKIGNQNLTDSLTYISTNAVAGDEFYIVIGADESISPKNLSYSGKTVGITLLGYGSERILTLNANGWMFFVEAGVTFTLDKNITLVGRSANDSTLVYIFRGDFIINEGAKIIGNTIHSTFFYNDCGGGVVIANGTFTMNGGEISGNKAISPDSLGGGVFIMNGGITINGGEISGNVSGASGGGVFVTSGTFTMSGGEIFGNTASDNGGGVSVSESETFIFTKSGSGTITGYASDTVNGNVVKDSSGVVLNNKGHAVYIDSSPVKRRECTAGPEVNLDSSVSGSAGGWE
ncbi:hypothetical protein R84B8_00572 [Treponema sp. R8-4-B8]